MLDRRRAQSRTLNALSTCVCLSLASALTACGLDAAQQPVSVAFGPVASGMDSSTQAQSAALSLTPLFSESIHDYVTHCAGAASVRLTVKLPPAVAIGLVEPSGATIASKTYGTGQFQQTMTMAAGQRLRFSLSNQSESYSIRCLPADFPPLEVPVSTATGTTLSDNASPLPQAQWYVFALGIQHAPGGPTPASYVIIADSNGTPVWWMNEPLGSVLDAKILSGDQIAWTTETAGKYFLRSFSGMLLNTLTGNLDDHELRLTPQATYLVIKTVQRVCPPDCADMSPWGGSAAAAVIDAEIHEIDGASNVIWTWRTRDHIALYETGEESWFPGVGNDIIHMNAISYVDPDHLLFSARHLNAIYHITKSTGAIDWKIGGAHRPESLIVTEDARPTALGPHGMVLNGQHDVRYWSDGTISVHDNGTDAGRPPYVVRYQVDTSSRTAEVVEEFTDPRVSFSICCGSARRIQGGHWLVDWGDNQLATEMVQGVPVLTIQYPTSNLFSYRAVPVLPGVVAADTLRAGMDAMAAAAQ